MTVFRYNIWFDDCDADDFQQRFVVAETEKEAEAKMEKYRLDCISNGISDFRYVGGWVEIQSVIV